jgi:hypothetical protein
MWPRTPGNTADTGAVHSDPMKTSESRLPETRLQRAEALVEQHVVALFEQMPMLCGFTLRDDLELDDVAVYTWPGYTAGEDLYRDLMSALAELADERPEAIELIRGRTFARAFH